MKTLVFILILFAQMAFAQKQNNNDGVTVAQVQKMISDSLASKWYEKIQLKGYAHFRYNRLLESNPKLNCPSCDKSIGDKQGFFMRRARLTFFGEINDKIYIYIQPDYATDANNQNYFQLRDAYFDYALSDNKEWRIRSGISKVPFGFDNLQSSSNRAPLDRDDALNTGTPNERDIGMFLMYAPAEIRKRFKDLTSNNLKGTGDYGMIAIGAYNGQSLNKKEQNNDLHRVVRFTYPFKLQNGQFIEASLQHYEGKFFVDNKQTGVTGKDNSLDSRQAASLVFYPQPFGFQVEYNVGQSPEYDRAQNKIATKNLKGGYAQINYQFYHHDHRFFPYVRYQEYKGGRKLESAATSDIREWEVGTEWQPHGAFELTAAYAISDRLIQSSATNRTHQTGNMLRLQAQFNY